MRGQVDFPAVEEMLEGASGTADVDVPLVPRLPAPEDQHLQRPERLVRVLAVKILLVPNQCSLTPLQPIECDLETPELPIILLEPVLHLLRLGKATYALDHLV